MGKWLENTYGCPAPSPGTAYEVANQVRSATEQSLESSLDLEPILELGGFELHLTDLAVSNGGSSGLLIALRNNKFRIAVDPTSLEKTYKDVVGSAEDCDLLLERRTRHIAAHEIAHSFFFWRRSEETPRRTVAYGSFGPPSPYRALEERFCEEFARQLLVPREALQYSNYEDEDIARRFNISVPLARLALLGRPMIKINPKNPTQFSYAIL